MKFACALLMAGVGAALMFRALFGVDLEHTLWGDDFDPNLLRWIAEWGYYALGQRYSLDLFWQGQAFYPHANSLAYSDSLITLQILYTPLRALGMAPLSALYASLAGFSMIGFLLTVFLLERLGYFLFWENLVLAYAAHFSLSFMNFAPHYQLFGFQLAPPFFLGLFLFCRELKLSWLALVLTLFGLGLGFAIYLAPVLFACAAVLLPFGLLLGIRRQGLRSFLSRLPIFAGLGLLAAAIIYFLIIQHYTEMIRSTAPQSFEESAIYSASPASILNGRSINSKWYKPPGGNYGKYGDWERAYFPGWLLLLGGSLGLFVLILKRETVAESERRVFGAAFLALGLFCLALSWGPFLDGIRMPFYYLSHLSPGLRSVRAPGRFGIFLGLSLGVLLAYALCALRSKVGRETVPTALCKIAVLGILAFESLTDFRVFNYQEPLRVRHEKLADWVPPDSVVVELPAHGDSHFNTIKRTLSQLNGALYHHGRLVVGYGGRSSEECQTLIALDQGLASGEKSFSQLLEFAKGVKAQALLINLDLYEPLVRERIKPAELESAGYKLVLSEPDYLIARSSLP